MHGGETILTDATRTHVNAGDYKKEYNLGRTLGKGAFAKVLGAAGVGGGHPELLFPLPLLGERFFVTRAVMRFLNQRQPRG